MNSTRAPMDHPLERYALRPVRSPQEWSVYHAIRRDAIFSALLPGQACAGKPHSGGKAIVLAGHALRLTRMRPGSMGTCGPTCGCRKRSPVPFHCFRVVLYNEGCNSDVSARAPDRATPCAIAGARALRQAHLRIRGQSGLGATLAARLEHADAIHRSRA